MIVEGILIVVVGFFDFVLSLFPTGNAPGWLDDGSTYLATVWGYASGLGAWIPWALVGQVFSAVMGAMVIGFTIKVVRIVASFFTAGGGSAA